MVARAVGLLLLLTLVPLRSAQPAAISAAELLEAYATRRFDVVDAMLSRVEHVGSVASDLQKTAEPWVRAARADPAAERARRFVASAVAVELAGRYLDARDAQQILIPWGAALLEKQAPDERERAWFLAANALVQRTHDPFFLPQFGRGVKGWNFAGHAIARFPGEDRFHLARAVDLELASWRTVQVQRLLQQHPSGLGTSWRTTLRELAVAFEKLLPRRSIAADVRLRLGNTYLRLERFDDALKTLAQVESGTTDPFLIHLSRYLTGRASRATGDLPGAARAFRSALDAVPHGQSASLALASLTLAGDDPADAYRLVQGAVARAADVNDPWKQYQEGEFRLWQSYIFALRQEVR